MAAPVMAHALKDWRVVVAIDFGTTFSGYAYSLLEDFKVYPFKFHLPVWRNSSVTGDSSKTPTCILFDPNGTFHSFGYEAKEKLRELALENSDADWYFFSKYKMILYESSEQKRKITRDLELTCGNDKKLPAMKVFTESLSFLRKRFLQDLRTYQAEANISIQQEEIHWVLTVPAIWSAKAKMFMREAAVNAGIDTECLELALEPEAASLHCRFLHTDRVEFDEVSLRSFLPGDKYLVLDVGGGTMDITVHEVDEDGKVIELHAANGGDVGGANVDKEYKQLLENIFGPDTMEIFVDKFKDDDLEMAESFEILKRSITPDKTEKLSVRVPKSIGDSFRLVNVEGTDFRSGCRASASLKDKVEFIHDRMNIDAEVMKGLYKDVIKKIITHLQDIFSKSEVAEVNRILMVGGFSESEILYDAVKTSFPNKRVIVPTEPGLAVLKGAVSSGFFPTFISARISPYTYGIQAFKHFESALDRKEKKVVMKQGNKTFILCKDYFSIHARIGELVKFRESRGKHEYVPSSGEDKLVVSVFRSEDPFPMYTDDDKSEKIGDIEVTFQDKSHTRDKPVTIEMIFGDTELEILLVEKNATDGQGPLNTRKAKFDCLKNENDSTNM